jgi:hypothetical protein
MFGITNFLFFFHILLAKQKRSEDKKFLENLEKKLLFLYIFFFIKTTYIFFLFLFVNQLSFTIFFFLQYTIFFSTFFFKYYIFYFLFLHNTAKIRLYRGKLIFLLLVSIKDSFSFDFLYIIFFYFSVSRSEFIL